MNFKPEEQAEIKIAAWLMENGLNVFTNRKGILHKNLGCKTFNISGDIRKKPDMIVLVGKEYFVLEIKTGIGGKATRECDKILTYYNACKTGATIYSIDEKQINPTVFLVASPFSLEGRLFDIEIIKSSRHTLKERRNYGCPDKEYALTHMFLRTLWDRWKKDKDVKYCLGALLSDKLNDGVGAPTCFLQKYNDFLCKWSPPHSHWLITPSGLIKYDNKHPASK